METVFSIIDSAERITDEVYAHFEKHDRSFYPPITDRNGIKGYINGMFAMNGRLVLCHVENKLVAVMGFCLDHPQWKAYYQYLAVDKEYQGTGIPKKISEVADKIVLAHGDTRIVTRTWSTNIAMLRFFSVSGYIHFQTIYDDRAEGVHTYLFTRLINLPEFRLPITRLAVIGGMGTYSTGNFISTLTSIPRTTRKEQNLLPFILLNEPSIPDRTECILENRVEDFITKVNETVAMADPANVSHILFLCFTLHPYINKLLLGEHIEKISLIDVIGRLIQNKRGKTILVATKGTYLNNPFRDFGFVIPDADDRESIHAVIMKIKSGAAPAYYQSMVVELAAKYGCSRLVLGCTDLHGMFGLSRTVREVDIIDPLLELVIWIQSARHAHKRTELLAKMKEIGITL